MIDLQKELELTYIFISHDLSVVKHISTDVGVMYLGQLIEKAPKKKIYERPLHPYTQALLSAIPSLDPESKKTRQILKGELTSPVNPKALCRFSARCDFADDRCFTSNPVYREFEPDHYVACHRVEEIIR
jgi:oligopeptide/dipeptide ABC transporter ATP-binding protein